MKEGSRDMKGLAEQYYWNHSSSYRFFNVMDHNFSQRMAIPEKFINNFNEDLFGSFVLKGPSGNFWLVKLHKVGDDLQFKDGWKEFVESHHIGEVGRPRKLASVPINQEDIQLSGLPAPPSSVQRISKRRPVTNEEKEKTWQLASAVKLANPSFRVMMRETHVYKRFFMTIPAEFVAEHLRCTWTAANLHIHNETGSWLNVFCRCQGSSLGLCGLKWRKFVEDNNLEEEDVCIFELTNATGVNLAFSVRIFRVVDEVIPLEKISVPPKGRDPLKK